MRRYFLELNERVRQEREVAEFDLAIENEERRRKGLLPIVRRGCGGCHKGKVR